MKADTHSSEGDRGIEPKSTARSASRVMAYLRRGRVYVRPLFGSGRSGMVSPDVARQRLHIRVEQHHARPARSRAVARTTRTAD